jgi:hypothetical protein
VRRWIALLLALAALLAPAAARADGDPASDVLYAGFVFFPFDVKFDSVLQSQLTELAVSSKDAGIPIRVALIAKRYDLGTVGALWLKPQQYARFLAAELAFLYKGRLLIVMPNGFGFWNASKPVAGELALLKAISIGPGPNGLAASAITAVQRLAAQAGHPLSKPKAAGRSSSRDRILIVAGAVALLALWVLLFRFRRPIRERIRGRRASE